MWSVLKLLHALREDLRLQNWPEACGAGGPGLGPLGVMVRPQDPGEYGLSRESRVGPGAQEGRGSDRTVPSDCESQVPPSPHQVHVLEPGWGLGPDSICSSPGMLGPF